MPFPVEWVLHPTQKPAALWEYLIRTYGNSRGLVLDNYMDSGTTCAAAVRSRRRDIGLEQDAWYFETAARRVEAAQGERAA